MVTPALYQPGSTHTVSFSGLLVGSSSFSAVADSAGQLHLVVPLGESQVPAAAGGRAVIGLPRVPPWSGKTTVAISASYG